MARRPSSLLILIVSLLTTPAWSGESITFSVNLIVDDTEATSIGRAVYQAPSLCLECKHWGNHRLNGGSASASWNLFGAYIYERQLSEFVPTQPTCYVGFIEGWGSAGFYGSQQTVQKCTPCVLWLDKSGSGSVSGAPSGKSSYNCGAGITLTASPATGWRFVRWGGSISSTSPSLSFTLDASKSLTAFFEEIPPPDNGNGDGDLVLQDSGCAGCGGSPLVVKLESGPWNFSGADDPVQFDIDADGDLDSITWTAPGAEIAFLALDFNSNGAIDSGRELFGNADSENGFEKLSGFDSNYDEVVDRHDAVWSHLLLWTDRNHNGESEPEEMRPLPTSGIETLDLHYKVLGRQDRNGNAFRLTSHLWRNGKKEKYYDVYFVFVR